MSQVVLFLWQKKKKKKTSTNKKDRVKTRIIKKKCSYRWENLKTEKMFGFVRVGCLIEGLNLVVSTRRVFWTWSRGVSTLNLGVSIWRIPWTWSRIIPVLRHPVDVLKSRESIHHASRSIPGGFFTPTLKTAADSIFLFPKYFMTWFFFNKHGTNYLYDDYNCTLHISGLDSQSGFLQT